MRTCLNSVFYRLSISLFSIFSIIYLLSIIDSYSASAVIFPSQRPDLYCSDSHSVPTPLMNHKLLLSWAWFICAFGFHLMKIDASGFLIEPCSSSPETHNCVWTWICHLYPMKAISDVVLCVFILTFNHSPLTRFWRFIVLALDILRFCESS